jgi:hypothetical protein
MITVSHSDIEGNDAGHVLEDVVLLERFGEAPKYVKQPTINNAIPHIIVTHIMFTGQSSQLRSLASLRYWL